jgi:threonine dehydratase
MNMRVSSRLELERIEAAARTIEPVFVNTPQFRVEALESALGCRLVLKVEVLNPIRSFKGRGASWLVSQLPTDTRLVCASAGNFGQAMAYACRSRSIALVVFASVNASGLKVERIRSFGAEVRLVGEDFDVAKLAARDFAGQTGRRFVEDSRDLATCEGAGTIGIELLRWPQEFDAVVAPLGNGAMLTGVARWVKAHSPRTSVIGVCATGAPAMAESWRSGRLIEYPSINTIAAGIGVRIPIREALADMVGLVDDVVLVGDEDLVKAMKLLHKQVGLVVEPSGAAGLAAIFAQPDRYRDRLVAAIISGGNLSPEEVRQWVI